MKGIPVKKLLALALCFLVAVGSAEARTLYVNAKRPNNNGNGLKPSTAKKTIQAAINIAKNGDTILVYPGNYAPIKTNNKKISIKSVKGASKTKIVQPKNDYGVALAQLGKAYMLSTGSSEPLTKGKNTLLSGFLLDGMHRVGTSYGISGGRARSCSIRRLGEDTYTTCKAAGNATLTGCSVLGNYGRLAEGCIFERCIITGNQGMHWRQGAFSGGRLCNCLLAGNKYFGTRGMASLFNAAMLVNCTVAGNATLGGANGPLGHKSKFYNCILRNNRRGGAVYNLGTGNTYSRTYKDNRDPKFVNKAPAKYKLAKGSPCINQGKVTAAQKKLLGSVDLGGAKRIRGKAIDMGCYEY
jgi:hypothetical protein